MKIRVMGTLEECTAFRDMFLESVNKEYAYSVSEFYPNNGNSNLYRIYIDFQPELKKPPAKRKRLRG